MTHPSQPVDRAQAGTLPTFEDRATVIWPAGKWLIYGQVCVGQRLDVEVWFVPAGVTVEAHWCARTAIPNVFYRSPGGEGSPATALGVGPTQERAELDLARKLVDRLTSLEVDLAEVQSRLRQYTQFVKPDDIWAEPPDPETDDTDDEASS